VVLLRAVLANALTAITAKPAGSTCRQRYRQYRGLQEVLQAVVVAVVVLLVVVVLLAMVLLAMPVGLLQWVLSC
jgi:hypothetical protein